MWLWVASPGGPDARARARSLSLCVPFDSLLPRPPGPAQTHRPSPHIASCTLHRSTRHPAYRLARRGWHAYRQQPLCNAIGGGSGLPLGHRHHTHLSLSSVRRHRRSPPDVPLTTQPFQGKIRKFHMCVAHHSPTSPTQPPLQPPPPPPPRWRAPSSTAKLSPGYVQPEAILSQPSRSWPCPSRVPTARGQASLTRGTSEGICASEWERIHRTRARAPSAAPREDASLGI